MGHYSVHHAVVLLVGFVIAAQGAQTIDISTSHSCIISGRVTDRGGPVKGAVVYVKRVQTPDELGITGEMRRLGIPIPENSVPQFVTSDEAGLFCFNVVAPSQYTVSAKKSGYMETAYGAASAFESGAIVSIKGSQGYAPIELRLIPQAVLTGRVYDPDGEPVDQGSVVVVSQVALRGKYRTVAMRTVAVNDVGEFRIAQLPPGQYYVRFQPASRPPLAPNIAGHQSVSSRMPRLIKTFYPSATSMAQAAPVMLHAGETISNIVITAQRHHTYAIRGRLAGLGGVREGAMMNISPADEEQAFMIAGGGNLREDNTFEFGDLSPQDYTITYLDQSSNYVQAPVTLGDSDVLNVVIRAAPSVQVKGRINMAGSTHVDLAKLKVALKPAADRLVSPVVTAKVGDNGMVTFDQPIPAGAYVLRVQCPEGSYVKSVQYGGVDVTDGIINISETAGDLAIVISSETGQLEVRVDQDNGAGGGSLYYIVARSQTVGDGQGLYMAVTRDDGTVVVKNMAPGRYRAYAFRSADFTAVRAAETLEALQEFSKTVDVGADTTGSLSVRVVPPDQAGLAFEGSMRSR